MNSGLASQIMAWAALSAYAISFIAFSFDLARQQAPEPVPAARGAMALAAPAARKLAAIGLATTTLGAAFHFAAIVLRGLAAGRLPWANMYEFTLVGSFVAVLVFLTVRRVRYLGAPVTGLTVLALGLAQSVFFVAAEGVQPALQSYWLAIHVTIAALAAGVLSIGFVYAALQLLRDHRDAGSPRLAGGRWGFLDALPTAEALERRSFEMNAVGFVLWTFTLIAGAIWAEHAWGRYWGWDPKEVWTFVIWVVYAAYLHARTTLGWAGRRAAWFVIAGFTLVIFNFTGVNFLFEGRHSYADLPN